MKKRLLQSTLIALAIAVPSLALAGKGTIDAASMKVTIYKFAVSLHQDCSDPVVVFSNADGIENDLLANPTYGSGHVDAGTYQCVMIEMSKLITTSAASSSGSCTQDLAFQDVICRDGQTAQLIDGTGITCAGDASNDQHVTLFITTLSGGNNGDASLLPPSSLTDSGSGLKLDAPLVVETDTPVTLKVDPRQFLDGTSSVCGTSAPDFGVD